MGSFFIMSISAYYLLKKRTRNSPALVFRALVLATIFSLVQLFRAFQRQMVAENQPAKLAAFEGQFQTGRGNLSVLGWPMWKPRSNALTSPFPAFELHGQRRFQQAGDRAGSRAARLLAAVLASFVSYHLMIAIGVFFIVLTLLASFFRIGGHCSKRWLLWIFVVRCCCGGGQ